MNKSIFSTYHNAENRVTSTILAVLERLSNPSHCSRTGSLVIL